jgi:hypothetical protein
MAFTRCDHSALGGEPLLSEDNPTPLCSAEQLRDGAFADLVHGFSDWAVADMLAAATQACETEVGRRLALFTGLIESHRVTGVDPDEYSDSARCSRVLGSGRSTACAGEHVFAPGSHRAAHRTPLAEMVVAPGY